MLLNFLKKILATGYGFAQCSCLFFENKITNQNKIIMKLKLLAFLLFILSNCSVIFSQQLKSPVEQYNKDRWRYTYKNGVKVDSVQKLFNPKMLNILFANKVGTSFGGSNDLSLQKFHASLDADDNSLSIGANFDSRRKDELKKLSWILSVGIKIKASNKFATVYKNGDFQEDNIGSTLKATWIGRGVINFNDKTKGKKKKLRKKAVKNNREELEKKYNAAAAKFNTDNLSDFDISQSNAINYDSDITSVQDALDDKTDASYVEMAKEEIKYLEDAKMYRYLWDHWYSIELFTPFGENTYNVATDLTTALSKKTFYAFNATASGTTMWQFSNGISTFINLQVSLKNNNNIIVDNISSKPFQTIVAGDNNINIVTESTDGYVTTYNEFITGTVKLEPAIFFLNNTIGLSPAIELNTGEYNETNWKLGIPVSFKDKDGKPKVNFEIQWKEQKTFNSSIHLVGISANFQFGNLIN